MGPSRSCRADFHPVRSLNTLLPEPYLKRRRIWRTKTRWINGARDSRSAISILYKSASEPRVQQGARPGEPKAELTNAIDLVQRQHRPCPLSSRYVERVYVEELCVAVLRREVPITGLARGQRNIDLVYYSDVEHMTPLSADTIHARSNHEYAILPLPK